MNKRHWILQLIMLLIPLTAMADEGMWTLYNLPQAVYDRMTQYGFQLPQSALYSDERSLKDCVVNFSGFCTGEVVSPDGLLMTNHHCGFDAVRKHSTVEHDYMVNGFYAQTMTDELPNQNMFVAFMKEQKDVTQRLEAMGLNRNDHMMTGELLDSLEEIMTEEAQKVDSTYYVEINAFYEGNVYIATTYQKYDDVRLVFAPPVSMGKFGGETDNWMWPRQTCDISVFRVYVDPVTGGPAPYSKDNVPMKPKNWLQVSTEGYRDGDFSMVLGYPGSTARYRSSYGIQQMRDCLDDPMQQVRGVKQQVMRRYMDASEEVRIKYDTKYATSSNYWKNAIGMMKCIDSIGIVGMKRDYEARLKAWSDSTGLYREELNFDRLDSLYQSCRAAKRAYTLFMESFSARSGNELAHRATRYYTGMPLQGPEDKPHKQYVKFEDNSKEWDKELDIEVLATLIDNYRSQYDTAYLPSFYKTLDEEFAGNSRRYVREMWEKSVLMKSGTKIPSMESKKQKNDLGLQFSMSLAETISDIRICMDKAQEEITNAERVLCAARLRMEQDMPHYSDANFTMRLSYGQVKGYSISDYNSGYYTTAQSIVDKMNRADEVSEYRAEPMMKELMMRKDFGKLTDPVSKQLNLCFLSNNDITGGNSGSPVIDGKGRLIGLAFDGNWDSLSADIFYDDTLARTISVDIRYIIYIMKEWAGADRLIKEMGIGY